MAHVWIEGRVRGQRAESIEIRSTSPHLLHGSVMHGLSRGAASDDSRSKATSHYLYATGQRSVETTPDLCDTAQINRTLRNGVARYATSGVLAEEPPLGDPS